MRTSSLAVIHLLHARVPWFVLGPLLGLLVVGLFAVANQPLGASGAYVQTAAAARRQVGAVAWRVWYFVGIALGGLLAAVLSGRFHLGAGYRALTAVWPLGVVAVVVFAGAVLMGYGARMAGGCTSGHGLCGTSQRSPASWAMTATFVSTAIVVTFVLHLATGGKL